MFVVIETQVRFMSIKQRPLEKNALISNWYPLFYISMKKIVNKDLYEIDSLWSIRRVTLNSLFIIKVLNCPQIANNAWKFHICEFWAKGLQLPSFQLTLTGSEVMLNHRWMIKLVKPRKEKKNNLDAFWMLTYEIL